jgi:hypothetical protein
MAGYDSFFSKDELLKKTEAELINIAINLTSPQDLMNVVRKQEEIILKKPFSPMNEKKEDAEEKYKRPQKPKKQSKS